MSLYQFQNLYHRDSPVCGVTLPTDLPRLPGELCTQTIISFVCTFCGTSGTLTTDPGMPSITLPGVPAPYENDPWRVEFLHIR